MDDLSDWMAALKAQHPDWVLQAIQSQPASSETGEEAGPIEGYTFYDPTKTSTSDKFKRYAPSGEFLGEQQFKKPGGIWDLVKQGTSDLAPILQFTPLAPFIRAITAMSAAEQGNVLGALAAGLPLADKIPGLDKATVTALQNAGKYASVVAAAKTKSPAQLLTALSQVPEFGGKIPEELKTAGKYLSTADALRRGNIGTLLGLTSNASPTSGQAASAGYGGADPGYFDPDAETSPLPDWALDPYKTDTTASQDDAYEDIENLLTRYTDQGFADTPTGDLSQSIDVTGTREKDIPDWDVLPDLVTTPRSIRDVGPVTQIQPGEKLEGTDITEPDLSKNLPTVPGKITLPKTPAKPATPATEPTTQVARTPGQPTVHNPFFAEVPEFDPGSMFQLADRTGMSLDDLLKILRG